MNDNASPERGFGARGLLVTALSAILFFWVDGILFKVAFDFDVGSDKFLAAIFFGVLGCLAGWAIWMGKRKARYRHVAYGLLCGWILTAMAIVGLALLNPNATRTPTECVNNLRLLDSAKQQWALVHGKQNTDTPAASDLLPYLGRGAQGELPYCPKDPTESFTNSYSINNVGTKPSCKICPSIHILQ